MDEQQPAAAQSAANPNTLQVANSPQQPANQPPAAPSGVGGSGGGLPYQPMPVLAAVLLAAAGVVIFFTGGWFLVEKSSPGYTGGGAAAAAGILIVVALVLRFPTLIMDDSPAAGGEPSAMRILSLSIVLTFCLIMLRTGWNMGTLPTVDGNWVWLVTAALGGKAIQKFAEIKDK